MYRELKKEKKMRESKRDCCCLLLCTRIDVDLQESIHLFFVCVCFFLFCFCYVYILRKKKVVKPCASPKKRFVKCFVFEMTRFV